MKDNFSKQAATYARYRPSYPAELYDFLFGHCNAFDLAWDCATGNGQVARVLASRFSHVEATDISAKQIEQAPKLDNVQYRVAPAENSSLPDASCDLITVAQAAHWFDRDTFYKEARRCLKPGGLLALIGYNLITVDEATDVLLNNYYTNTLKDYWDPERKLIDESYTTIDFPFDELAFPDMRMEIQWSHQDLLGFLDSWSATQHFIRKNGRSPVDQAFRQALAACWPVDEVKTVTFPMFGRVGRTE